jgi:hypothetical protein
MYMARTDGPSPLRRLGFVIVPDIIGCFLVIVLKLTMVSFTYKECKQFT